ncbi:MAG TPA: chemotaxis protein CheW [Xanthobacteraceae bacterium]|nr:chemotaxis protein CheW [Xanthobacteraceae bacterium]
MDELLREFLTETSESLDTVDLELVRFEQDPNNADILDKIFRLVHTVKGTCGFLGLPRLEALAHAAETLMSRFRAGSPVTGEAVTLILAVIDRIKDILAVLERDQNEPAGGDTDLIAPLERLAAQSVAPAARDPDERHNPPAPARGQVRSTAESGGEDHKPDAGVARQSIRVQVDTLERLMTIVSELVLTRNQLLDMARRLDAPEFHGPLQRLSSVTAELQDGVMKTRMQPIGVAWQKLPRIVRDLGSELGKDIALQTFGADTELDRQVLELIRDPLTHMVRNSADHGIETAAERRARGKPETGTIRLSAQHEGGHILIEIADDGRGLDTDRIKAKALAAGLVAPTDLEGMSEAQVHQFIFVPGFTTAERVTNISGRGVGMDVVKSNVEQIGGTVDVKSIPGAGTSFVLKIPLTLAIVAALIVECGGERFAIPQLAVLELVRANGGVEHRIERIQGAPVLRLRNRLLPLVHLGRLLGIAERSGTEKGDFIVVTQVGGQRFGIVVDGVFHTEEIVVKPLSRKLRHLSVFSGNTILGDGSVILILDPSGVAQGLGAASMRGQDVEPAAPEPGAGEEKSSFLVFRAGSQEPKAVPLSLVTRLEVVDGKTIEMANGRHLVQYRGRLMPLLRANERVAIRRDGRQPVLVFAEGGRAMGLVVDEIVDIVEDRAKIELSATTPGVLGSAVIDGRATEILDVSHFLPLAFEDWFRGRSEERQRRTPRVLLVDDSPFFREMLRAQLQAAGYSVALAAGGAEALALLAGETDFAVIISDIEMPAMSGLELAAAVRADERLCHIPLIALSSYVASASIEPVRAAGFAQFVAKFDRPGLIAAVNDATLSLQRAA